MGFLVAVARSLQPKQNTNRLISDTKIRSCTVGTFAPTGDIEANVTPLVDSPDVASQ